MSIALVDHLLKAYKNPKNPNRRSIRRLLDNIDLHILHSMNPDGFENSLEGDKDSYQGRGNDNDVDLNR